MTKDGHQLLVQKRGRFIVLSTSKGHRVEFDGNQLLLKLPVTYFGLVSVCCLLPIRVIFNNLQYFVGFCKYFINHVCQGNMFQRPLHHFLLFKHARYQLLRCRLFVPPNALLISPDRCVVAAIKCIVLTRTIQLVNLWITCFKFTNYRVTNFVILEGLEGQNVTHYKRKIAFRLVKFLFSRKQGFCLLSNLVSRVIRCAGCAATSTAIHKTIL